MVRAKFKVGDLVEYLGGSTGYHFGGSLGKAEKGQQFTISYVGIGRFGDKIYSVEGSYQDKANWSNMEKNFKLIRSFKIQKEKTLKYNLSKEIALKTGAKTTVELTKFIIDALNKTYNLKIGESEDLDKLKTEWEKLGLNV